ncbi:MAG: metalloregulator ArsR/SmtB family transcription factor [Planctomycetes bacterium]|nr:metalloregulator ArsR/SmtB family transcription factor [Planctomycetota bacterium]
MTAAPDLAHLLKALADPTRLRMLALLDGRELTVGELSRALGMSQSRVSNHLRLLRETGLFAERRSGTSTFLRLAPDRGGALQDGLWNAIHSELATLAAHRKDLTRLERLLEDRERSQARLFDEIAADWDKIGADFATGQARQRAAACLVPRGMVIADVGCGTGYLARGLAGLVERIICIDRSKPMLDQARKRLASERPEAQVEFRRGELHALPLRAAEVDGLLAGMVLHHLADLGPALREMRRALKPGAPLVVLELEPHSQDWMRDELGDRHLGFESAFVARALERAGFESVNVEPVDDHYTPRPKRSKSTPTELPVYLVRAFAPRSP